MDADDQKATWTTLTFQPRTGDAVMEQVLAADDAGLRNSAVRACGRLASHLVGTLLSGRSSSAAGELKEQRSCNPLRDFSY